MFGAGYVGLVTAACFAELGHVVRLYDADARKVALLRGGGLPIHEPGLAEVVARNVRAERLQFASEPAAAVAGARAVFIAVGTPQAPDGRADISAVRAAATAIAHAVDGPTLVVNKSTVPVETGDLVAAIVREQQPQDHDVRIVSNPEFLREGSALADFMHPDRIVFGCDDPQAEAVMRELYAPLDAPVVVVDVRTAEMIKYTANAFLATKISFINEIAGICERVGADINAVVAGVGADRRIGPAFFKAGIGFGGSCLPKDVSALVRIAQDSDVEPVLLTAVLAVNARQVERIAARAEKLLGGLHARRIAVLGLAFKGGTDDVRESPALALVRRLLDAGAKVVAHDPLAVANARAVLGDCISYADGDDHHAPAAGADALIVATEWNGYRTLDYARLRRLMRGDALIDARNVLDGRAARAAGFRYLGVGR
ncbi:MAG: UDP-glucose/GDP-mannose dehydrogenase family protein [Candidatus Velthaea sp.]